jgi:hypothetical protein
MALVQRRCSNLRITNVCLLALRVYLHAEVDSVLIVSCDFYSFDGAFQSRLSTLQVTIDHWTFNHRDGNWHTSL